jgi:LysR family transcriptional regulator, glycine cleavage system transcriptional activator
MSTTRQRGSKAEAPLRGRLPPLSMLRAFDAVGRTSSMRQAADDIGVTHTVVSRHVRDLEAWIGQKLVESGPRGTRLTPAGRSLFATTSEAFRAIARTAMQLRVNSRAKVLKVWCMPGLATRWLAPRLTTIRRILPDVDINLRALDHTAGTANIDADLVIGFGFGDIEHLPANSIALVRPRMFPVASPEWLAENGRPASPAALAGCPLIHEESYEQWAAWLDAAGVVMQRPLSGIRLGDAGMGLDAALAGQGIALTTRLVAAREIEAGRLEELLDTDIRLGGYYLTQVNDDPEKDYVSRFREWLVTAIRADVA